jgi:hypothetical protein
MCKVRTVKRLGAEKPAAKTKGRAAPARDAKGKTGSVATPANVANCQDCGMVISEDTRALQCERCDRSDGWICMDCMGLSEECYELLSAASPKSQLHWFCSECEKVVLENLHEQSDTAQLMKQMMKRLTDLEEKLDKKQDSGAFEVLNQHMQSLDDKMDRLVAAAMGEQGSAGMEGVPKKSLDEAVQRVVDRHLSDDRDLDNRKRNLIIYRVPEDTNDTLEIGKEKDKKYFFSLCSESLQVGVEEGDVAKMFRLGKKTENGKPRPLLVGFKSEEKKSEIMKNLRKLRDAGDEYRNISVSHDLTPTQREAVRKALGEARKQEGGGTGQKQENSRFKVVGLGSRIRVVRVERH